MDIEHTDDQWAVFDKSRAWALMVGGILFMFSGAIGLTSILDAMVGNPALDMVFFLASFTGIGFVMSMAYGSTETTARVWGFFLSATGISVICWPADLVVHSIRGYDYTQSGSYVLSFLTWPAVGACTLLGGLLIAIGFAVGRPRRARGSWIPAPRRTSIGR